MKTRRLHELSKRIASVICLKIKAGPLKGYRWILSTGTNFISGKYEMEKTQGIVGVIESGMIAVDVGAHVGYYSLIMANGVGPSGRVYAFEPRDLNRNFLKKHIRVNGVENVEVSSNCVGDREGTVSFETRTGTGTGHISEEGNVSVEMTTLDSSIKNGRVREPDFLKIDVEGAEVQVLKGASETIRSKRPVMVLAVHSDALERECRDILEPLGYIFEDLGQEKGDKEFLVRVPST